MTPASVESADAPARVEARRHRNRRRAQLRRTRHDVSRGRNTTTSSRPSVRFGAFCSAGPRCSQSREAPTRSRRRVWRVSWRLHSVFLVGACDRVNCGGPLDVATEHGAARWRACDRGLDAGPLLRREARGPGPGRADRHQAAVDCGLDRIRVARARSIYGAGLFIKRLGDQKHAPVGCGRYAPGVDKRPRENESSRT